MATTPTDKIRLLLSIIQLCVNKIISQFSTLNPIPLFNPISENSTESISVVRVDLIDQSATVLLCDQKPLRVNVCLHKKQKARKHDKSVKYDQFVNYLNERTKPNPPPLAAIIFAFTVRVPLEYARSAHAQEAYPLTRTSHIALQVVRTSFGFHLRECMGSCFPPPPPGLNMSVNCVRTL